MLPERSASASVGHDKRFGDDPRGSGQITERAATTAVFAELLSKLVSYISDFLDELSDSRNDGEKKKSKINDVVFVAHNLLTAQTDRSLGPKRRALTKAAGHPQKATSGTNKP